MSSIYDTEPQPTASVILHTTEGEIAVELFAKQTPLTSRNFLQHCLDGYYDNTIFHRLVPGFVIQGGDPTGTGNGGESIYDGGALAGDLDPWPMDERRGLNAGPQGIGFKDEFHSRLKFNRRGLLGMANEGKLDTNGSQFFFTLDKTDELNGKNTMFGRVAGPTIYNLAKMGQGEVQEGTERPMYPVVLKSVEILTNPFDDMRKQERVAKQVERPASPTEKKKSKRKKGVNKTLLSFGDDIEDAEEDEVEASRGKRKVAKTSKGKEPEKRSSRADTPPAPKEASNHITTLPSRAVPTAAKPGPVSEKEEAEAGSGYGSESEPEAPPPKKKQSELDRTNAEIAALKASMRRTVHAEPVAAPGKKKSALEDLVPANAKRGKKLSRKNGLSSHDEKTLNMLNKFRSKIGSASSSLVQSSPDTPKKDEEGAVEEEHVEVCDLHFIANCQSCRPWVQEEEDKEDSDKEDDWMAHTLNCEADKLGKDLNDRRKAEEELIVIDPREKAQALKEERRAAREARGDSRSGRARDQARHAQMSRASALSGRGAR